MCSAVSTFDPESKFIFNVLSRLEAAMGIQIVAILAKAHSQLTSTSGVKLQARVDRRGNKIPLPDPHRAPGKHVEEVISQWSAGHSHRPPTWGELLNVLQEIGPLKLIQQIEVYIKGIYYS